MNEIKCHPQELVKALVEIYAIARARRYGPRETPFIVGKINAIAEIALKKACGDECIYAIPIGEINDD